MPEIRAVIGFLDEITVFLNLPKNHTGEKNLCVSHAGSDETASNEPRSTPRITEARPRCLGLIAARRRKTISRKRLPVPASRQEGECDGRARAAYWPISVHSAIQPMMAQGPPMHASRVQPKFRSKRPKLRNKASMHPANSACIWTHICARDTSRIVSQGQRRMNWSQSSALRGFSFRGGSRPLFEAGSRA
jgi:hypothetical protein